MKIIPEHRVTSDPILFVESNEIFVFGSNLAGRHAGGAALAALNWGAQMGNPIGFQGRTYAVPTVVGFVIKSI